MEEVRADASHLRKDRSRGLLCGVVTQHHAPGERRQGRIIRRRAAFIADLGDGIDSSHAVLGNALDEGVERVLGQFLGIGVVRGLVAAEHEEPLQASPHVDLEHEAASLVLDLVCPPGNGLLLRGLPMLEVPLILLHRDVSY